MNKLETDYLGLTLTSPLVPSSSPLCEHLDQLKRMEDAGAGAVVLPSLFEEQLTVQGLDLDRQLSRGAYSHPEAGAYLPEMEAYNLGPDGYLEHLRLAKEALSIPVIASLNGATPGGWVDHARLMEKAGADAVELNLYLLAADPDRPAEQVEESLLEIVREVRSRTALPLAVKLHPFFSSLPHMARLLCEAGASGLVLFNRFYQPDFDVERLEVVSDLDLSRSDSLRLRLRWTSLLFGRVPADLAVTGGVHSGRDAVKCFMAGAKVAMTASALLRQGVGRLAEMRSELERWLDENEYDSVRQMIGSMGRDNLEDLTALERANYMKVLRGYTLRRSALE